MYQNSVLRDEAVNPIWQEEGGHLVIAIDSIPLKGVPTKALSFKGIWDEWVADTGIPGLLGSSSYRWGGTDLPWNPGAGILAYRIHIKTPGEYTLALRSRHDEGKGDTCFVRIDGGQWLITRAGETDWSWYTSRETSRTTAEPFRLALSEGFHQIEISGRTRGFSVERLALHVDESEVGTNLPLSIRRPR